MLALVDEVRNNIAEMEQLMDAVESQAQASNSNAHTLVIKKLRNDMSKEQVHDIYMMHPAPLTPLSDRPRSIRCWALPPAPPLPQPAPTILSMPLPYSGKDHSPAPQDSSSPPW